MANQPNEMSRLPLDANGNVGQLAYRCITGTLTLATNTATDDLTLPKGALAVTFWATVAYGFLGIGATSGTEVTMLANQVYTFGCMGTDGTWKAYFDRNVTTPATVNYVIQMGATN